MSTGRNRDVVAILTKLRKLNEVDVAIPPEIAIQFENWKRDPSSFLGSNHALIPTPTPSRLYRYTLTIQEARTTKLETLTKARDTGLLSLSPNASPAPSEQEATADVLINTILWRFLTTVYYKTIQARSLLSDRYAAGGEGLVFVVTSICKSSPYEFVAVKKNVIAWAREAKNRTLLAEKLGSSASHFLFTRSADNWLFTKNLHLECYDLVVARLLELGIHKKARESQAGSLAKRIESQLGGAFQHSIILSAQDHVKPRWPVASPPANLRLDGLNNILYDFYVHKICFGRTIIGKNEYLEDFAPALYAAGDLPSPLLALSASYYKEYFDEGSPQRLQMEWSENYHNMRTARQIREAIEKGNTGATTAIRSALLLHHATIDPYHHSGSCWTDYILPFVPSTADAGPQFGVYLIIASVSILAMTALPLYGKRNFQSYSYDWVGSDKTQRSTEVNSSLGLSPRLLYLIHRVTQEAKVSPPRNTDTADDLLKGIDLLQQWIDETEDQVPRNIALKTAQTYKLGTRLYLLCRLFSYTPAHPDVQETCDQLFCTLFELPTTGEFYSSIHPAWSFVIACLCTRNESQYNELSSCLARIAGENKSNVDDVCSLVARAREWQFRKWKDCDTQHVDIGWWEGMVKDIAKETVVCLA